MRRKTTMSLSLDVLLSLPVSLSVSWCQLSTRYQCLLLHIAIKAISAGSNPAFHTVFHLYFSLFSSTFHLLFTYRQHTNDNSQILHSSGMISSFKWFIYPKPNLTCFPLDLWKLIPYLWTTPVSVLGDKDIFSSLELLAQEWIIIQFHGKAQTAFFVSSTKSIFYFFSNGATITLGDVHR